MTPADAPPPPDFGPGAALAFGPDAALPAGYARLTAGARVQRGHSPGRHPGFFGPPVGEPGRNRFDVTGPRLAVVPGVCYLAVGMVGVLLERVLRGVQLPVLSRARLDRAHAWSEAEVGRALVLLDLWAAPGVHGLQLADISAPPRRVPAPRAGEAYAVAPDGRPVVPYPRTQQLAEEWAARSLAAAFPVPGGRVDGVLYGSRFGPGSLCVALWEPAAPALRWGNACPLGQAPGLAEAANRIGVGLVT